MEPRIVKAIEIMYTNTQAKVLKFSRLMEKQIFFEILTGVLQGDTLSPYLFIIAIDYVMRNWIVEELGFTLNQGYAARRPRKPNKMKASPEYFTDSDYADDLCILSDSKRSTEGPRKKCFSWGGAPHKSRKTKYMCFNQTGTDLTSRWLPLYRLMGRQNRKRSFCQDSQSISGL